ncbi:hypothetical protein COCNU_16G007050 [Cocos nucifera]|uniref:Uncharacterized protein n=1 Tax=Cocos nucifera TaxID=13894 RepID=A0A8K0IYR9_COCNU|nr:hypothetical protein COCNU_16G007050 [Cocos nucifera]
MEHQVSDLHKKGRPLPKRGQIKKKIFESLVRAVVPKGSKKGDKSQEEGFAPSTPSPSGYTSEAGSEC